MSYAEADTAIEALSAHFVESGLPANSVIAIQLPNTVEFVLTVLAAHRAGLVVALLPLLWRHAELTAALEPHRGARHRHHEPDRRRQSCRSRHERGGGAFSIRHVCGFGTDLPEGMASLDDVLARRPAPRAP